MKYHADRAGERRDQIMGSIAQIIAAPFIGIGVIGAIVAGLAILLGGVS